MMFLAWPTLVRNIRATTRQSWMRFLVGTAVVVSVGSIVVFFVAHETPEQIAERIYKQGQRGGVFSSYTYYGSGPMESNVHTNPEVELSGDAQWWHENGQPWSEGFYVQGRPHGQFKMWHDNGQLSWEALYFDGELQGEAVAWDASGKPVSAVNIQPRSLTELEYEREQEVARETARSSGGTYVGFFRDGQKRIEEHFDTNGKFHGMFRRWYWNGELQEENRYVGGHLEGLSSRYYENGQIQEERLYENGRGTFTKTTWYKNGQMERESNDTSGARIDRGWKEDGTFIGNCNGNASPCSPKREEE